MKNYKKRLLHLLALSFTMMSASCEDRRMNNMAEDKVYLNNFGLNNQNIYKGENFNYNLQVIKSGVGSQNGEVTLNVDETLLAKYYGTKYTLLPASYYTLKSSVLTIGKSDYQVPFEISFDATGIEALQVETKLIYAVPFKLSAGGSLKTAAESQLYSVFVPTVLSPYLQFKTAGLAPGTSSISLSRAPAETKFYAFVQTNYNNKADLHYKVEVDESVLTAYNLEKKTNHVILPAQAYRLDASSFLVPNLNNEQGLSYYVVRDKASKGSYMLPLKITEVSKFGINPAKSTMIIPVSIQD
ncbi:DUF1735 domain-containing protein [Dyadobacter sp. LHD-138]|uniref:DUF1735 domain-containing protein n=1 Tax=Dyadobacter sp. LHD-138 TaxID=3071413 RepID=UPI0027DF6932|nr:DUF1735 domain-containing protein [Dyadobacter sp. LHD-138]MDQ6480704.1 DUF1735 domain-containing protein [Dyadobacter sp. LHD-138]